MDSRKGFAIMEQFVAMLPSIPLREKLQWSLEGPKPFRRFRDTLLRDLPVRDQWHEFHAESMRKIALEWLANLGVEPTEPTNTEAPSLLDREAHGLKKAETSDSDTEDTGEQELDENLDENFDDDLDGFDEEGYGETVDLSEEEEAELADFVESLPGTGFNLAKLHGLLSAFCCRADTASAGRYPGAAQGGCGRTECWRYRGIRGYSQAIEPVLWWNYRSLRVRVVRPPASAEGSHGNGPRRRDHLLVQRVHAGGRSPQNTLAALVQGSPSRESHFADCGPGRGGKASSVGNGNRRGDSLDGLEHDR